NIGILNHLMESLTGIEKAFNIYTFWGMVWVHSLEMVPLTYLLISAAFQSMDPRLEEASVMTGAGIIRTFRRISLPLALPAVAAVLLLLFITTVDTFDVPLLLGGRAEVPVYATEVFFNISRTPTDWGLASAYSMSLLILSVILLAVYFWLLRNSERYQTVTGKDFRPHRIDLGRWKYVTSAVSLLITFLITGVPFLMMLYASFLTYFEQPSLSAFQAMNLKNYEALLGEEGFIVEPLVNSTLLGIGTATAVMLVVSAIAYYVHKTRIAGRKGLDFLAFSSIAFPSVVLGTAFLWLYLIVPAPILGTLTIIGLAYLTKYMPIALRFVSNSMLQIHDELEEAAVVAGVPWWKNFFCIFLPLLRPGLMAGWFWVMVHAFRELTIALVLAQSENRTAAVLIYDLWEEGSFQQLSAFGVLMFLILIVLVAIAHAIGGRFGIREQP
ncbi:MAG: iron ABC transporter permease, partial [Alphaproteobacteria bacterium]